MSAVLSREWQARVVGAARAERGAVALPEAGHGRLVQDHLGDRGELDAGQRLGGPLGRRVEPLGRVQRVPEQVEPHRAALARRPHVDDAAADRVIARLGDGGRLGEPHAREEAPQRRLVDPVADAGAEHRLAQHRARRHPLGGGVERGQQDEALWQFLRKRRQRSHPVGGDVRVGRDPVVGQAIPGREREDRHVRGEERQGRLHRRQALVVARHMDHRPAGLLEFGHDQPRVEALGRAAHRQVLLRCHGGHVTAARPVSTPPRRARPRPHSARG